MDDTNDKPKVRRNASNPGNMGKGRLKGVPNKATKEFRDIINALIVANAENVPRWLEQVAETEPGRALDLLSKLAEYAAPKLARTEHVGKESEPIVFKWQK